MTTTNVYYAGDKFTITSELLKNGKLYPLPAGYEAKMALLNKKYELVLADRTAPLDQPGGASVTGEFTGTETAPLLAGIYYVRVRLEHATDDPITMRPEAVEVQVVE